MIKTTLFICALLALYGVAGKLEADDAQDQVEEYCAMVELFDRTGGQSGWPAYDGRGKCK